MKSRRDQQGFTLIELIIVLSIIAILMATSVKYYQDNMQQARKAGVQLLFSNFATAISLLHVKWITEQRPRSLQLDEDTEIVMSSRGWPVGARAPYIQEGAGACEQLWEGMLQNPQTLYREESGPIRSGQYRVLRPSRGVCRFDMASKDAQLLYFEYDSSSGRIKSSLN